MSKIRLFALLLGLFVTKANAINLQGYQFSDAFRFAVIEDTMILKHPGSWVFTTSLAYINNPLVVSDEASEDKLRDFLDSFTMATFGFSYYFSKTLSAGIDVPYIMAKYSDEISSFTIDPIAAGRAGEKFSGLGDVSLRAKWRAYTNLKNRFAISIMPKLTFATGSEEAFTTDDGLRASILVVAEKYFQRWSLQGAIGYSKGADGAQYREVDYRQILPTQFGISYRINNTWNANFESTRDFALKGGDKQDAGDYYLTMKGKVHDKFSLYFGGGIAGTNEVDRDNWTLFAGLKLHGAESEKVQAVAKAAEPMPEPAPLPEPVPEPLPVIEKVENREQEKLLGTLYKVDRVYFANSSSMIDQKSRNTLDEVANYLLENGNGVSKVIIEGYASKVGRKDFNQVLSDTRSKNVMKYLIDKGVNPDLLQSVAYGDDYQNEEPEHWQNRRVEFRVYNRQRQLIPTSGSTTTTSTSVVTDSTELSDLNGLPPDPSASTTVIRNTTIVNQNISSRDQEKSLGTLYKINRVYFANSSWNFDQKSISTLNEAVSYLKNTPNVSGVVIEGYASKIGKADFNQMLSEKRSENVMNYLINNGVSPSLLKRVSYGDSYQNEEPEEWQNRRVEFRIYNN